MNATPVYSQAFQGDFTSQKALTFKQSILAVIEKGTTNIVLDFTATKEVDLVGMNALVMIYKQLHSQGATLTIKLTKDSQLAEMLHLTKFDKMFTICY